MTPSPIDRPLSRRALLRGATVAGAGALAAYVVGCGDDGEDGPSPTAEPGGTTGAPTAPTATPALPTTASWELIAPEGEVPSPRRDHSLYTDGTQLIAFAGRSSGRPLSGLWSYGVASGAWSRIETVDSPPVRFGHNALRASANTSEKASMVVFGGQADANQFYNDVWVFDPGSGLWQQGTAGDTAPEPRYGAAAATEASSGRMIITHGFTTQGRFDDTWAWQDGAWTDLSPAGERPLERCLTRAVWDPASDRLIMFGGQTDATPFLGDTWALEANGWREIIAEPSPPARSFYAMAFDEERGIAVLFGGDTAGGGLNDVWVFDPRAEAWHEIVQSGPVPSPRQGHDAVWVAGQGMYVFGGNDGSADLNDLWLLTLS